MLNRIYIIIGSLAIIILAGAFLAPILIDWNSYRERMEFIAKKAIGKEVQIRGDMSLSLLPQPRLSFSDVIIGTKANNIATIEKISAQFTLLDFLRDSYNITNLVIQNPLINLTIDSNGKFISPLNLPKNITDSKISIKHANIENASIKLTDERVDEIIAIDGFNGELSLAGLYGPFSLQGSAKHKEQQYRTQINSSALGKDNHMQLGIIISPKDNSSIMNIDGIINVQNPLSFEGKVQYRLYAPDISTQQERQEELGIRGDLLFNANISATLNEILFKDYTIVPDENRPVTRLSGVASIDLNNRREFDAIISGGVVTLGVHNQIIENNDNSYGLLKILNELPMPIMPPIAGRIGMDILELDLGIFSLKDVRIDATTNGRNWKVNNFSAKLKADTEINLSGNLANVDNKISFDGNLLLTTNRLEELSQSWRRIVSSNIAINTNASLQGLVQLNSEEFSINDGIFTLDNVESDLSFSVNLGAQPSLSLKAKLGSFNEKGSRTLLALLPKVGANTRFNNNFPIGSFDISSKSIELFDLPIQQSIAIGNWSKEKIYFSILSAKDFGGANFELSGTYVQSSANPQMWGQGQISLANSASLDALPSMFEYLKVPVFTRGLLLKSLPANLEIALSEPNEKQSQQLTINGQANVSDIALSLYMGEGIFNIVNAPINAQIGLSSKQSELFFEQLSLTEDMFSDTKNVSLKASIDGAIMNSLGVNLSLNSGDEQFDFAGNIIVSDVKKWRGNGKLQLIIQDISPLLEYAGIPRFAFVPFTGTANVKFSGNKDISLSEIEGRSGNRKISGELARNIVANKMSFSGALNLSELDVQTLAILLGGPSSMIRGESLWPEGPFSLLEKTPQSNGNIVLKSPFLSYNDKLLVTQPSFKFIFDKENIRIRDFKAKMGDGEIELDLSICCNASEKTRQINGRISSKNVNLKEIFPKNISNILAGTITSSVQFLGMGDSFANIISDLSADGSLTIDNLEIKQLNPNIFSTLSLHENIIELQQDALEDIILSSLNNGAFNASQINSILTSAAGTIRLSNVAIQNETIRLFGSTRFNLKNLTLSGKWALTPMIISDISGLIDKTNALIKIAISGTLIDPKANYDFAQLIDGISVKALELELDELEKLRIEAEERAKQAALIRAKFLAEQAKAKAEAERLAKEEEERLKALALEQQQDEPLQIITSPLDLLGDGLGAPPLTYR